MGGAVEWEENLWCMGFFLLLLSIHLGVSIYHYIMCMCMCRRERDVVELQDIHTHNSRLTACRLHTIFAVAN